MEAVPPAVLMAAKAVGFSFAKEAPDWLKLH
jgi:hypothetical protein